MSEQYQCRMFALQGANIRFFVSLISPQAFINSFLPKKGSLLMETLLTLLKWIGKQFTRSNKEIEDARTVNDITIQSLDALTKQINTLSQQLTDMNTRFDECDQAHHQATHRIHELELENGALKREIIQLKVSLAETKDEVKIIQQVTQ